MTGVHWLPPKAPGAQEPPRYEQRDGEPVPPPARRWEAPPRRRSAPTPAPQRSAASPAPPAVAPPGSGPPALPDAATPPAAAPAGPTFTTKGGKLTPPARIAMIVGVLSLGLLVLSIGVAAVPCAAMSALAGWLSQRERRRLGRDGLGPEGWIALIGVIAACLALVAWAVLAANGIEPGDLERELRELQRDLEQAR